jgi:hypothetical protein
MLQKLLWIVTHCDIKFWQFVWLPHIQVANAELGLPSFEYVVYGMWWPEIFLPYHLSLAFEKQIPSDDFFSENDF